MGLLLSVLVVCVGVLEAISCVRHVQHGFLPCWLPSRMRPICHEPSRRRPNDAADSSDDDDHDGTTDELSRILQNGVRHGGRGSKGSPSYGLTPILTEHRRRTPILRDADDVSDDDDDAGRPKYVLENNIDECCTSADSNHVALLTDSFRPISPSDEPDAPLDESYVSSTGKFLEVPAEDGSPLQRSSSEETLHDSEGHSPRAVDETSAPSGDVVSGAVEDAEDVEDVVFKIDEASPIVDNDNDREFGYPESRFSQTLHLDEEGNNITEVPEEEEDLCLTNDPVFNLVSAAAFILRNEAEYEQSDLLPRKGEQVFATTSSCRPLSMGTSVRIPAPQAHRESMPFDLMAAHASSAAARGDSGSRPETPGRRSRADISWPVFHPEPVIKRPLHTHGDVDRGDSIEEDLDLEDRPPAPGDSLKTDLVVVVDDDDVHSTDLHPHEVRSQTVPEETSSVPSVPVPVPVPAAEPPVQKVDISLVEKTEVGIAEDQCSKTVVRGSASAPVTPFVLIPGSGRPGKSRSLLELEEDEDLPRPGPATVDRFGRITSRARKGHPRRRRGSLERTQATPTEGSLKDSVMSKSLPDFFFEENMASKPVLAVEEDVENRVNEEVGEVPETEPVGRDITRKESSIKRRRGYRKKTRSTWSPSRAKNRLSGDKSMSSTESYGDTDEEGKGGSIDETSVLSSTILETETASANESTEKTTDDRVRSERTRTTVEPTNQSVETTTVSRVGSESTSTPVQPANQIVEKTTVSRVGSESTRPPVEPSNESAARTTVSKVTSEAIVNIARAPVEVLHHGDVQPESAVFAVTTQQLTKRLQKPAKAESFEEAAPPPPPPPQTTATTTPTGQSNTTRALDDTAPSPRVPAPRKPDETIAKPEVEGKKEKEDDEEDVDEDEEEEDADEPQATNLKQPQESSEPAPFWLIFSGEYTKAMSKDWHSGHFCCWQCDESLTGQRYVLRDDHPYCIKCYESVFANMCEECSKTIGIDSKDLSYKDKHWHEACFLCNKCRVSLVDKQFGSKADKIYCSNCYDAQFASRCDGCGEIFRAGTKKMEYKTRQWHEKCFCCCVCKTAIGTKSFIPREQEIYCATCYEEKFATRCVKCNKIITSGGVTYKNEPWHRECFTCTHCNTSLAGQRFTSRDEKPYCAECFGELFAKRCTACSKPITGIGGTRFISFEDRHWHNDCFICATCRTSLVGRGFITDADDIICPECAKQKLM